MGARSASVLALYLRVMDRDVSDGIDLPKLESIHMGDCAFIFNSVYNSELTMRSSEVL